MFDLKINCPICNQEFPAYDQRGFRNAGFTAHHKKCLERQQQPSDFQQRDQHASRASRFALAVRRRLLPARPPSSTSQVMEGQNRISPLSPFSGSSSTSSSSSSMPLIQPDITPAMTPVVPSQTPDPNHRLHPQQRHTWNHWTHRRKSNQFVLCVDMTSTVPSSSIVPAATRATLSDSRLVRPPPSSHTMDTEPDSPTFPLLIAITTMDSTTALIIPQVASPQLSNQTPMNSPMMSGDGSPFSFTSMLTTLPVESAPLLPSATISTSSSNSNSVNDRSSLEAGYQRPTQHTSMDSIPSDWVLGQYIYPPADDASLYHHHYQQNQHRPPYRTVNTNVNSQQPGTDNTYYHQSSDNVIFPIPSTSSSQPDTLPTPLDSAETLDGSDDNPIHYCGYCQPQNGQHHPSCSFLQFLMMDIIGGHDDPSISSP